MTDSSNREVGRNFAKCLVGAMTLGFVAVALLLCAARPQTASLEQSPSPQEMHHNNWWPFGASSLGEEEEAEMFSDDMVPLQDERVLGSRSQRYRVGARPKKKHLKSENKTISGAAYYYYNGGGSPYDFSSWNGGDDDDDYYWGGTSSFGSSGCRRCRSRRSWYYNGNGGGGAAFGSSRSGFVYSGRRGSFGFVSGRSGGGWRSRGGGSRNGFSTNGWNGGGRSYYGRGWNGWN